ncbi:MAG: ECF transporter S component [Candidatus Baldrarchaeia archaeon]
MNTSLNTTKSRKISVIAIFASMAIASAYASSMIPNVELMSFMVFVAGYIYGSYAGALVGLIAMGIYGIWNPWGGAVPPIFIAQVGCTALIGAVGGITNKVLNTPNSGSEKALGAAALGGVLTIIYDLITNYAYAVAFGLAQQFVLVLIAGAWFSLIHVISNTIIFGILLTPVSRTLKNTLGLNNGTVRENRWRDEH